MKKNIQIRNKIHIKVGEQVKVISGKDKGKVGLVKKIIRSKNKIVVEGVNIRFKHSKSVRPGQAGEIKRFESPIHGSNVLEYKE